MPETTLPKPLAAYVGLLVASYEDARGTGRSAAAQAVRLPFATVGQLRTARQRYDELAVNGDVLADGLVGNVLGGVGGVVGGVVGKVRQRLGSGGEATTDWIGEAFDVDGEADGADDHAAAANDVATQVKTFADEQANGAGGTLERLADQVETIFDEKVTGFGPRDSGEDRQKLTDAITETDDEAPVPAPQPVQTPLQQLESFSVDPEIGAQAGGLKASGDLPLEDFDHMSGPQLRGRLRRLDRVQLVQLLDYERAHANRVGIILLLENRLTKLNAAG